MDRDEIIALASARTGLSDIGDARVLEGLEILLHSYETEARLTPAGLERSIGFVVDMMANRMKVVDWLKRHPELETRPVERPTFVFGLPRTGTTLTINLLASDPARRALLRWEALDAVPPPRPEELHAGPRYEAAQARLDMAVKYMPQIAAIHYEDADSPTECQYPMAQSFCAQIYEAQADIPTYREWFLNASYRPAMEHEKRVLQLLQAHAGGRWTLKNPWHPLYLDDLVAAFPDARLVMTHRDPAEVVGSACSLIKQVRRMFSDDVDLPGIGRSMVDIFERMIARADAFRAKHGADAILDVQYEDQLRDPVGEMRRLYERLDEPFTEEAETAMRATLAANPKGKHGRHDYSLEEFGLSAGAVRERFAGYVARYDIPVKG